MDLTVGKLREVFGDEYPAINFALDGREDDEIIGYGDMILRSNYLAVKLWSRDDVEMILEMLGYKGTKEQVDTVLKVAGKEFDYLAEPTESDWFSIEQACADAGFKDKN